MLCVKFGQNPSRESKHVHKRLIRLLDKLTFNTIQIKSKFKWYFAVTKYIEISRVVLSLLRKNRRMCRKPSVGSNLFFEMPLKIERQS
jgi:hypothetical protein